MLSGNQTYSCTTGACNQKNYIRDVGSTADLADVSDFCCFSLILDTPDAPGTLGTLLPVVPLVLVVLGVLLVLVVLVVLRISYLISLQPLLFKLYSCICVFVFVYLDVRHLGTLFLRSREL